MTPSFFVFPLYFRHRVLVVNNVCCLIFFIVFSSLFINNFHRPSSVALFYFIGCLLIEMYVFESFLSLHHLFAN